VYSISPTTIWFKSGNIKSIRKLVNALRGGKLTRTEEIRKYLNLERTFIPKICLIQKCVHKLFIIFGAMLIA
jgi:hypothetical protein